MPTLFSSAAPLHRLQYVGVEHARLECSYTKDGVSTSGEKHRSSLEAQKGPQLVGVRTE